MQYFDVKVILPVPRGECTSLGGDAKGFYLMQVYSCIYHRHKPHSKHLRQTDVIYMYMWTRPVVSLHTPHEFNVFSFTLKTIDTEGFKANTQNE